MSEETVKEEKKSTEKQQKQSVRRTLIGGQALLEGVMMRGASGMAMAVRAPDGEIEVKTERIAKSKAMRIPIVRGVIAFVNSFVMGMRCITESMRVSTPEEETPSSTATAFAMIIGVVIAVGLFIGLPVLISWLIETYANYHNPSVLGIIEGVARLLIFVIYLLLVRRMDDIHRTFMYHGSEHRTINCYERGLTLNVENVQSCSVKHNRCGTTFLFFVVIFTIIVYSLLNFLFALTNNPWLVTWYVKLLIRLALLPFIAGLSYELLRGLAMLPDNKFTNALRAPGLLLQKLTTAKPDDSMAEVAIASFNAVLEMDENPSAPTIDFFERDFQKELKALREYLSPNEQDADWIYCEILKCGRAELSTVKRIGKFDCQKARELAERLKNGEPLDYVLGNADFCGFTIKSDSRALAPRFETELLCEEAVKCGGNRVLDLCTGSGAIAFVLAKKLVSAEIVAADIDDAALSLAKENLDGTGVQLVKSNMFDRLDGTFDLIVSNPPYIKTADIPTLQKEVTCQPHIALDGGEDGLDFYRVIAENGAFLRDGGTLIVEVGDGQAAEVAELFGKIGKTEIIKDLDRKERIVKCKK